MEYDAITLDSNIFIAADGIYLEGGMLAQLSQFQEGNIKFVLSDIVMREVRRRLVLQTDKIREGFQSSIKKTRRHALVSDVQMSVLEGIGAQVLDPKDAAQGRLDGFLAATGCEIIDSNDADVKELLRRYFETCPPFEDSEKKKTEFPDAFALLSLEAWAKKNEAKILAISNDRGWSAFAEQSEWIDVEPELAPALEKMQQYGVVARQIVTDSLAMLSVPGTVESNAIFERVSDELEAITPDVEAHSAFQYDLEGARVYAKNFRFPKDGDNFDFNIVRIGRGLITVRAKVEIDADAEADFSFSVWDGIDKEYVSMGSTSAKTEITFDAGLLLSFVNEAGEGEEESYALDTNSIELVDAQPTADFDEVGMDWGRGSE